MDWFQIKQQNVLNNFELYSMLNMFCKVSCESYMFSVCQSKRCCRQTTLNNTLNLRSNNPVLEILATSLYWHPENISDVNVYIFLKKLFYSAAFFCFDVIYKFYTKMAIWRFPWRVFWGESHRKVWSAPLHRHFTFYCEHKSAWKKEIYI